MNDELSAAALRDQIQEASKDALRARDKPRLATLRLMLAAIKQREVDERITLDDAQTITVLERMVQQRRESIRQYRDAGRQDLVDQEQAELSLIQEYLPQQLDAAAVQQAIELALAETGAESMRDMGKVMALLKQRLASRADMAAVSASVKAHFQ